VDPLEVLKSIVTQSRERLTIILVLTTHADVPPWCAPMPRNPSPPTGIPLDSAFASYFLSQLVSNPSLGDGAIVAHMGSKRQVATVLHWSCRLFPPSSPAKRIANKGSAYNSALDLSVCAGIDSVFLANADEIRNFRRGEEVRFAQLLNRNPS
jgi:hypothetical protein